MYFETFSSSRSLNSVTKNFTLNLTQGVIIDRIYCILNHTETWNSNAPTLVTPACHKIRAKCGILCPKTLIFNGETTPLHTFLCSDSHCLPPGDPIILCAKHGSPITGKSLITIRLIPKHPESGSTYYLYGKSGNFGEISNGTVHSGGNFSEKQVIRFEVLLFSRSYRNDRNLLYHLFGLPVPSFFSRESEKFTGYFVNSTSHSRSCFRCQKIRRELSV